MGLYLSAEALSWEPTAQAGPERSALGSRRLLRGDHAPRCTPGHLLQRTPGAGPADLCEACMWGPAAPASSQPDVL